MNLDEQMGLLFVEEAEESLRDFEQALLLLESLPDDAELIGRMFRCVHTLKGNSRILGFDSVERFAHKLESLLDAVRNHELMVTQGVADTLLVSLDVLKELVTEVGGGPPHDITAYDSADLRMHVLLAEIGAAHQPRPEPPVFDLPSPEELEPAPVYGKNPTRPAPPHEAAPQPHVAIRPAPPEHPQHAAQTIAPPPPPEVQTESARAAEAREAAKLELPEAAKPVAPANNTQMDAMAAVPPAAPNAKPAAATKDRRLPAGDGESNSVRVPIDKLDRLINLTGEVVIAQSIIAQLVTDLTAERVSMLQEVVAQMDRHCRELQERMLGARMLPLRNVFTRFHRLVRDLSGTTGKSIRLEMSGEDTELDKTVIEKISDPLTHLIRNAMDHGVEMPEERKASGKPAQACVAINAYQKGGNIFIEIEDDGRGINRDKVLNKAKTCGLVRPDAVLSDDEIHQLIFHPGFSTADKVTEISGRGVGMDVVKRNVEALKGSITIISNPGKGTCFRIKLPLTLAILDGLGLRVGTEVYLVPLVAVVESLQPKRSDVHALPTAGEVVDVRGECLPLIRLHELFGLTPLHRHPSDGLIMVIDDGSQKLALQIDELIGQYQVVIKSLEANFQAVPGIAGATVLGDGRVALILDTGNLGTLARTRAGGAVDAAESVQAFVPGSAA